MERISITIPKPLLKKLDDFVENFTHGDIDGKRSRYIVKLISAHTPFLE